MHKFIYLIILIVLFVSNNLSAQEKFEKESRIKINEVPNKALIFIDSIKNENKIKWYKEEGLISKSIEAKFKHNKTKYSIEFDSIGNVEDIEIEENWEDLEDKIRDSVSVQLSYDCLKYKIVKVQKQYTGSESNLISVLKNIENSQSLVTKYELIVRCSRQKKVDLFEYLFNNKGELISTSIIVFRNSSHLEY
jgi:hypothetical protein